jgi:hypothetical protein
MQHASISTAWPMVEGMALMSRYLPLLENPSPASSSPCHELINKVTPSRKGILTQMPCHGRGWCGASHCHPDPLLSPRVRTSMSSLSCTPAGNIMSATPSPDPLLSLHMDGTQDEDKLALSTWPQHELAPSAWPPTCPIYWLPASDLVP